MNGAQSQRDPLASARIDEATRKRLVQSLNHLDHQLQAIRGLLEESLDAQAILTQLAAARGTLTNAAAAVIVESCGGEHSAVTERVARAVTLFSSWERYLPNHDREEESE